MRIVGLSTNLAPPGYIFTELFICARVLYTISANSNISKLPRVKIGTQTLKRGPYNQ